MGWILSLLGMLFKLWRSAPDPKVVEGGKLGAVSQALEQETATNVEVQKASDARAGAAAVAADPVQLRKFESSDPNNRDNA